MWCRSVHVEDGRFRLCRVGNGRRSCFWVVTLAFKFLLNAKRFPHPPVHHNKSFAITALAYSIGHVSGGHINCAVTLGLVIAGACPVVDGLVIVCGQILGSLFGAGLLAGVFSKKMDATGALGSNAFSPGFGAGNVFIGECLMTFLLFFVVAECALRKRLDFNPKIFMDGVGFNPPIAIGFAVFLAHMVLIPVDGCSINPTRSFGPLVVASMRGLPKGSTHWENFPVFFFAPMIGASIAGLYYRLTKTSRGDNS